MDTQDELRLMLRIAQMYYEKDMTQNEISQELGIYRTTISRLIKKAREKGIVKISIQYGLSQSFTMERSLMERFGLREAIVVPDAGGSRETRLAGMGSACAKLLERIAGDSDVVGFSWGSAMAEVVRGMEDAAEEKRNTVFVPLLGGPSGRLESRYHVNTLVYAAALKLKGESVLIDVPAILERKETREQIAQSQYFRQIAELWDRLSIAVFGIGSVRIKGTANWNSFYGRELEDELEKGQIAGDICSQFFDGSGKPVGTGIDQRILAFPLERLKQLPYAVGVAESVEKVDAIVGALRGGYMNVLVTTEETAGLILDRTEG